jgi:hypothetical protein
MLSFEALNKRQASRTGRTDRIIIIIVTTTTTRMGGGQQGGKSRGARATTTLEHAEAIAQVSQLNN